MHQTLPTPGRRRRCQPDPGGEGNAFGGRPTAGGGTAGQPCITQRRGGGGAGFPGGSGRRQSGRGGDTGIYRDADETDRGVRTVPSIGRRESGTYPREEVPKCWSSGSKDWLYQR